MICGQTLQGSLSLHPSQFPPITCMSFALLQLPRYITLWIASHLHSSAQLIWSSVSSYHLMTSSYCQFIISKYFYHGLYIFWIINAYYREQGAECWALWNSMGTALWSLKYPSTLTLHLCHYARCGSNFPLCRSLVFSQKTTVYKLNEALSSTWLECGLPERSPTFGHYTSLCVDRPVLPAIHTAYCAFCFGENCVSQLIENIWYLLRSLGEMC